MSNVLLIYNQLRAAGVSRAGALGLLGNWKAESGLEPCRLQNDFSAGRIYSRSYTDDVTAGRITRAQFARDQKGYGLAQWTYFNFSTGQGRKLELYDFWKKSGKALDDVSMQVAFALHELTTEGQYAGLWQILRTTDDIWTDTDKVCRLYEQPYYCNVDTRFRYAKELEEKISAAESTPSEKDTGTVSSVREDSVTVPSVRPAAPLFYPYRMIDKSMAGTDVAVLQAVLSARGYYPGELDGIFSDVLDAAVRKFQMDHDLVVDGVCGPMTWRKILEME